VNHHKFQIGDLVAYKNGQPADYLFGKDYGIVTGYGKGQEGQVYYRILWAKEHPRNILNLFGYGQLNLIASVEKRL